VSPATRWVELLPCDQSAASPRVSCSASGSWGQLGATLGPWARKWLMTGCFYCSFPCEFPSLPRGRACPLSLMSHLSLCRQCICILHVMTYHHHHHHPWASSELFAILPYCRSVRLLLLWIPEQFNFYSVRLSASRPTPNLEDQVIPLRLAPTPRPVQPGWPLPVATLPPVKLSGSQEHLNPTNTIRWG
jgi:hypothetical protein